MNKFTKDEIQKAIQIVDYVKGGITHEMLQAYLATNMWVTPEIRFGNFEWWWMEKRTCVAVPVNRSFADYSLRIEDAINDIAEEEGKNPIIVKLQILLACS